ncbi:unnamed protein product [Penicillium roqueforti FM164]|uniref:Genomic scaffold, ProqFM164S03 n=1 Tax=Penicillium roqueforti (strain FM164) TaxID=1365484 RepID=W6QY38_PENRF|nr:unnamed protein product [Penicillium roqueforti FM164]
MSTNAANGVSDSRPVFFFDIDNCRSSTQLATSTMKCRH